MGKSAVISVRAANETLRSLVASDGHVCPQISQNFGTFSSSSDRYDGLMVPHRGKHPKRAFLDGNFVRRTLRPADKEYCIWDSELIGFGLRVRPTGRTFWFVRVRHRNKHRRIALGNTDDVNAVAARSEARRLLAEVALDGLPKRVMVKSTPIMTDFVEAYWPDLARGWKDSTASRNLHCWKRYLQPQFGDRYVASIVRSDVQSWRDGCAGNNEANFNRCVPVLASFMKYAEALKLRRKNSNPCKGMARYKRLAMERYLTAKEYRRLAQELAEEEATHPAQVAIVLLLIFTGARVSEIRDLQWEWVKPPRLVLPDSATGPKTICLNSQALAVLDAVPKHDESLLVFPDKRGKAPVNLGGWWPQFRRKCALPDVRLHDLRHSFASVAITDQVPLATIGKLLGHVLPETTAKYAHLADDAIADAAQRVSGSLASALGLPQ